MNVTCPLCDGEHSLPEEIPSGTEFRIYCRECTAELVGDWEEFSVAIYRTDRIIVQKPPSIHRKPSIRCTECERAGERGSHKGDTVFTCPECDCILFRDFNGGDSGEGQ